MKPFLLLSIRAEEAAAVDEHAAFLRHTGLAGDRLRRVRLQEEELGRVDLDDWAGVLLGGGPFNASDPDEQKSPVQRRVEAELADLVGRVVAADFPFLGACYGIGVLGSAVGGRVDRTYPEPVGPLAVTLTPEGEADPLFAGVPRDFAAYGGHKEALTEVPGGVTVLATSAACPVQAFRVGTHVYATQFHPELDTEGVCTRIDVYKHAGYFDPAEATTLQAASRAVQVSHPMTVLANFVRRYAG